MRCMMERFITDELYDNLEISKTRKLEVSEEKIFCKLSSLIAEKDYMEMEEELTLYLAMLEREMFYWGFMLGIRFLIKSLLAGSTEVK